MQPITQRCERSFIGPLFCLGKKPLISQTIRRFRHIDSWPRHAEFCAVNRSARPTNTSTSAEATEPMPVKPSDQELPRLMTSSQAARYLGYESTAVLGAIPVKAVRLSAVGIGKSARYDRRALDQYLDGLSGIKDNAAVTSLGDEAESLFAGWKQRHAIND